MSPGPLRSAPAGRLSRYSSLWLDLYCGSPSISSGSISRPRMTSPTGAVVFGGRERDRAVPGETVAAVAEAEAAVCMGPYGPWLRARCRFGGG